ncbi:MAG: flagellar hook-associated protein FlgK [Magnetococcales bacterium]|nr:flagellar hook-associated protein FlgK [Magnetococcales bacterium]
MSINNILNTAKLGLFANQGALRVVSHNVSNVSTPGYSRQTAVMVANPGLQRGGDGKSAGDGVHIEQVKQQLDNLMDRRLQGGEAELGRLEGRDRFMNMIENVFNELDGDGLSTRLEKLFTSIDLLTDNPTDAVVRDQVMENAGATSGFIKRMYNGLSELTLPVDKEITVTLDDINSRLKSIRDVNLAIVRQDATPAKALDLKDQRRQMVMELGKIVDIQTIDQGDGGVSILTANGIMLMDHTYAATLSRGPGSATQNTPQTIRVDERTGDLTSEIKSGTLKGLIEVRDQVINGDSGFLSKLETLADEMRWRFNRVHSQSVPGGLLQSRTGAIDLGQNLTTAMSGLVTDTTQSTYVGSPVDLSRVVNGTLSFAYGADPNGTLTQANVPITTGMSINDVVTAINANAGAGVTASVSGNRLVLTGTGGNSFGVVSDASGVLAALGVGAFFTGSGAASMGVDAAMQAKPALLGTGRFITTGATPVHNDANNEGAMLLGDLRTEKFTLFGESATLISHYGTIAGNLGSEQSRNQAEMTSIQSSQGFMRDLRDSVSGVSLEEEMTDMIKFQRAFQASSKMVSTADNLFETLIQMV